MLCLESAEGERSIAAWRRMRDEGANLSSLCAEVLRWNDERPDLPFSVRHIEAKKVLGQSLTDEQQAYETFMERATRFARSAFPPSPIEVLLSVKEQLHQQLNPLERQVHRRIFASEHPMHAWIWAKRDISLKLNPFQQKVYELMVSGDFKPDAAVQKAIAIMLPELSAAM